MGCGVAVLAMLTGKTYEDVAAAFPEKDLTESGIDLFEMDGYMRARGFYRTDQRKAYRHGTMEKTDPWPPEPYADLHLCNVHVYPWSPCNHWVLMLADGSVLDPVSPYPWRLTDYDAVNSVVAIKREGP